MTDRISQLRDYVFSRKHHSFRRELTQEETELILPRITSGTYADRAAERLILFLEHETPQTLPEQRILLMRTIKSFPGIYKPGELEEIAKNHYIHEQGKVCNICSDYESVLKYGLEPKRLMAAGRDDGFSKNIVRIIDAVYAFAKRYGLQESIVKNGASGYMEALQLFRLLHFTLWCAGNYHNTVGRFDQFFYPFYKKDIDSGRMTKEQALELTEEFFISFNIDSDLYQGMQQGDNGQSMVLGGVDRKGSSAFNELSELCLQASLEVRMIDPKINLRVCADTPPEIFELGTRLTRVGLGFPQYSNDDVVIPGLAAKGYELEDARDYVAAACWEFIIPKVGMDIPNIGALPLAEITRQAVIENLAEARSFDQLMNTVRALIDTRVKKLTAGFTNLYLEPAPWQSVLMSGCVENARDISEGLKYNNYGIHITAISTAADSLAAVKKLVFDEKRVSPQTLIAALENNFKGYEALCTELRNKAPKLGRDEDVVPIAKNLLDTCADALEGIRNERGGIYRGGTGTAMYYLWHGASLGATADGRKKGEPLAANFSPSLNMRSSVPISVIGAFSMPEQLKRVINGGPLTIELHDSVFRDEESIQKVAMLVRSFIRRGGHQLQINAVNSEKLRAAQKDPDSYRNLIVRVWGWSGYFVELDREYQEQILARVEYESC